MVLTLTYDEADQLAAYLLNAADVLYASGVPQGVVHIGLEADNIRVTAVAGAKVDLPRREILSGAAPVCDDRDAVLAGIKAGVEGRRKPHTAANLLYHDLRDACQDEIERGKIFKFTIRQNQEDCQYAAKVWFSPLVDDIGEVSVYWDKPEENPE